MNILFVNKFNKKVDFEFYSLMILIMHNHIFLLKFSRFEITIQYKNQKFSHKIVSLRVVSLNSYIGINTFSSTMKLVKTTLPVLLSSAVYGVLVDDEGDIRNIEHSCTDGSRDFVVDFTYNPTTEGGAAIQLGSVTVGTCESDVISVDSDGDMHTITAPHPWDCGLADNRNSSISTYSYDMSFSFDAVVISQGLEIVKHSYIKSVSCQYSDSYSASFNFNEDGISMPDSDDGETEGDTMLTFQIKSFTDNTYTTESSIDTPFEAGNTAYLQAEVVGDFDASMMEWSVAKCNINETISGVEYPLFDYANNQCSNDHIFLSVNEVDSRTKQIEYMIFLFDLPTLQQNYEIICDIEVCMKSADGSVCDLVSSCFGFDDDESGST